MKVNDINELRGEGGLKHSRWRKVNYKPEKEMDERFRWVEGKPGQCTSSISKANDRQF